MSRDLVLTGLGNEVDLKTKKQIFTAVFNGNVRIEISEEAAKVLTKEIFSSNGASSSDYEKPPIAADEDDNESPVLTDTPGIYEDGDDGVEQV